MGFICKYIKPYCVNELRNPFSCHLDILIVRKTKSSKKTKKSLFPNQNKVSMQAFSRKIINSALTNEK